MKYIFVDTNIIIFASGDLHPYKEPSRVLLEKVATNKIKAITNTEVLQEILCRYWAIGEHERGFSILEKVIEIFPLILSVSKNDVLKAKEILKEHPKIEPCDAIHAGIMLNYGIKTVFSYDRHYDRIHKINRIEP